MSYWLRSATLQIGAYRFGLDQLSFEFTVSSEDTPTVAVADVKVYNLSASTRGCVSQGTPIILNAGYADDRGTLFLGEVAEYKHERSGTDWITTIKAADSMMRWMSAAVNKTYDGPVYASEIIDDLLNIFGVEVGLFQLTTDLLYKRGRVCSGKLKDILVEIVTRDCGSRLVVRTGQILINNPADGVSTGVLISPETGLLRTTSSGESIGGDAAGGEGNGASQTTIKRTCLLNYRIGVPDIVVVRDSQLNGAYRVEHVAHKGSATGAWTTEIELTPA